MYIKCGAKDRERFFDVQNVAAALDHNVCCAPPGMLSFTGCDTVSAFGGKGKMNASKLIQKNKKYQEAEVESGQLPPCEDYPTVPKPTGHGWCKRRWTACNLPNERISSSRSS